MAENEQQNRTNQPETYLDFVNYLVHLSDSEVIWSVTNLSLTDTQITEKLVKCDALNLLESPLSNLERVKKCKELYYDDMKNMINDAFFEPKQLLNGGGIDLLRKNERISSLLRQKGNEYYKKREFEKALRCYTLASSYAPPLSDFEALAYSNRSSCFFEMGNFSKCLQDIDRFDWISNHNQPTETSERVAVRKSKCLLKLTDKENGLDQSEKKIVKSLKLNAPGKSIPVAEDFIAIKQTDVRGRHIVNDGNAVVAPGTLLILEDPYAQISADAFSFHAKYCQACFKDLCGGGVPCSGCVFVLYCSEECATSSHQQLHSKYECALSPFLHELHMTGSLHLSLQIIFKLMSTKMFPNSKLSVNEDPNAFYDPTSYSTTIGNLIYHEASLSAGKLLRYCIDSLLIIEIIDSATNYFGGNDSVKDELASLLLSHQIMLPFNTYAQEKPNFVVGDCKGKPRLKWEGYHKVGMGIFPLLSKMNHSCDPNTFSVVLPTGTRAVFATQYIVPGQEITTSYRSHFMFTDVEERRKALQSSYNFWCECPPCKFGWRTNYLPRFDGVDKEVLGICPNCRINLDVGDSGKFSGFAEIILVNCESVFTCPKCNWMISAQILEMEREEHVKKLKSLYDLLLKVNLHEYVDIQKAVCCLSYFDKNILKPAPLYSAALGVFWKALCLQVNKIFD